MKIKEFAVAILLVFAGLISGFATPMRYSRGGEKSWTVVPDKGLTDGSLNFWGSLYTLQI